MALRNEISAKEDALQKLRSDHAAMTAELESTRRQLHLRPALPTSLGGDMSSRQSEQPQVSQDDKMALKAEIKSLRKALSAKTVNREARTLCRQLSNAISQGLYSGFKRGDKLIASHERMQKLLAQAGELTQCSLSDDTTSSSSASNGAPKLLSSSFSPPDTLSLSSDQVTPIPQEAQDSVQSSVSVAPILVDLTSPSRPDQQGRPINSPTLAQSSDEKARPNADKVAQFRQGLKTMGKRSACDDDGLVDMIGIPPKRQCTDSFGLGAKERDQQRKAAAKAAKQREQEEKRNQRELQRAQLEAEKKAQREAQKEAKAAKQKKAKEMLAERKEAAKAARAKGQLLTRGRVNFPEQSTSSDNRAANEDDQDSELDDALAIAVAEYDKEESLEWGMQLLEEPDSDNEHHDDHDENDLATNNEALRADDNNVFAPTAPPMPEEGEEDVSEHE